MGKRSLRLGLDAGQRPDGLVPGVGAGAAAALHPAHDHGAGQDQAAPLVVSRARCACAHAPGQAAAILRAAVSVAYSMVSSLALRKVALAAGGRATSVVSIRSDDGQTADVFCYRILGAVLDAEAKRGASRRRN